ncbi:YT521-B-like domain-containing protein [Fomitopsis serialis]|uniref:YT521-B-like domain-containing protein n=1 Tax=Fomitopsis serialis TaxID=139415 RepID=UPI002007823B|nr:YT521-B-like domain-containing protein [Neoantrodia serialis]KAH9936140.1 YT521-B-like domain-containing protein [Neoantrodia serialis]
MPPEAGTSAASSARSGTAQSRRGQPRSNPPMQRSEWVMWVGNVPSDASYDELWRFLNRTPTPPASSSASSSSSRNNVWGGLMSIFLITRSNCAFVNFTSEAHLLAAIDHFNGQQLRPGDPRCPRLVCRVRGREDDLKAGVGGQRGAGLHVRWIRNQKEKAGSRRGRRARKCAGGRHRYGPHPHSSSSGSYASTSSSILMQHFPKRYFILKSLTQRDLDISVKEGLWATQKHNELTLDQAYRTSKEVYLIFGVNKSGEFYGYARYEGPSWGEPFKVQWIRTERLPFYRTRQLRNPWNHDREVKVSRDGTELEPAVGQALLEEWDKPAPPSPPAEAPVGERRARGPATGNPSC